MEKFDTESEQNIETLCQEEHPNMSDSKINPGAAGISTDAYPTSYDSLPSISDVLGSSNLNPMELSDETYASIVFPEALSDDIIARDISSSLLNPVTESSITLNTDYNLSTFSQTRSSIFPYDSTSYNETTPANMDFLFSKTDPLAVDTTQVPLILHPESELNIETSCQGELQKMSSSKFNTGSGSTSTDADPTFYDSLPSILDLLESSNSNPIELSYEAYESIVLPEALSDNSWESSIDTDFDLPLISQTRSLPDANPSYNEANTSNADSLLSKAETSASNTTQVPLIPSSNPGPANENYASQFYHPDITQTQINEVCVVAHQYAKYFGKPGFISRHVWERISTKVLHDNKHIKFVFSPLNILEKKKDWAIREASKLTGKEAKALTFVIEARQILSVFDYIPPTAVMKCDFVDPKEEDHYIQLALTEMHTVRPNMTFQ